MTFGPVSSVDPAIYGSPPPGSTLPNGLISFRLDDVPVGGAATVRIYSSSLVGVNGYAKYHDGAWSSLAPANVAVDLAGGFVEIVLTDGAIGDDDGTANGSILDPGGPAVVVLNTAPTVRADMGVAGLEEVGFQTNAVVITGSLVDAQGNGPFTDERQVDRHRQLHSADRDERFQVHSSQSCIRAPAFVRPRCGSATRSAHAAPTP